MPNQTKTIGAAGDYTTITAWEAASDVSGGWWKGEIIDAAEFNENVTFSGPTGTPSISNYVWLTSQAGVKHSGKAGTSHARVRGSTNGSHVFTLSEQYVRIEHLEIQQDSTGASDEGIRVASGAEHAVISMCILWTDQTVGGTDGIYAGNYAADFHIDNCVIYGWRRAGLHAQNYSTSTPSTQTWTVDFCTINRCGDSGELESGAINSRTGHTSSVNNINVYNTGGFHTRSIYDDFSEFGTSGARNWTGSNNACSDTSLTTIGLTTGAQESLTLIATTQSSGSWFVVKNSTAGSEDYQLLDDAAGNSAYGSGIDRVGSEGDSRQDFSLDIVGNTRSTTSPAPDIGASEYIVAGGNTITVSQAEAGDITVSSIVSPRNISSSQSEAGDTATASVVGIVTATVSANQAGQGDATAVTVKPLSTISANNSEAGDTASAAIRALISIDSSQEELGDAQTASIVGVLTAVITAAQAEIGDVSVAGINVIVQASASQSGAGDSTVAELQNVAQISVSQSNAGDATIAAISSLMLANISASQSEIGDAASASLKAIGQITADQTEAGDAQAAAAQVLTQILANQAEAGDTQAAAFTVGIIVLETGRIFTTSLPQRTFKAAVPQRTFKAAA